MRRASTRLVPLGPGYAVQSSAARLSPVNIFEAALSLQGLIMRQGLGRGRKRQIPCTDTDVAPSGGRGHVTVTVIALSPTVQYHLSNLCPEEEPLSSFGFAPLSSPSNGDRHTSTPARPGTVRPVTFGGLGVAPTFERAPLGTGMASRARPVGTGRARSTYRHWSTGGARNTCARYSLLADSLPRWYLPEQSGQGGDAVGEGGRQGGEGGYAGASQPASQACQPARRPVPSAQCQSQRQCDPRFPVSVLKVYLTLSVSHPAPRPFLLILSSPKPVTAPKSVSAAVAASNPRSLFANTLRKSSSTPVIRFVFLFSFRQPV